MQILSSLNSVFLQLRLSTRAGWLAAPFNNMGDTRYIKAQQNNDERGEVTIR